MSTTAKGIFWLGNFSLKKLALVIKSIMDYLFALIILLTCFPLMFLIAIFIKLASPGSVFFLQKRIGKNGKIFDFIKFRTMCLDAEVKLEACLAENPELKQEWESYYTLKNDPRIIPYVGHFLRKTSLDELPNLFNVLLGDISLVGPRPLPLYEYDALANDFKILRETCMPGVTGLWQVHRGDTKALIQLDSHYIRNWSLLMDLKVLWSTLTMVLLVRKEHY